MYDNSKFNQHRTTKPYHSSSHHDEGFEWIERGSNGASSKENFSVKNSKTETADRTFGTDLGNRRKSTKSRKELLDKNGRGTLVYGRYRPEPPKARTGKVANDRMASITAQQEAFARKGQKTESTRNLMNNVGRGNVAAERMASITAQQEAFSRKGQKTESTRNLLNSKVGRGNVAAEKMAQIKAQQEAFSKKGQNISKARTRNATKERMAAIRAHEDSHLGKGERTESSFQNFGKSNAAKKIASIKAQQEAFSRKGQKTESDFPKVGRGNIAAERMASIRAQQEAFSRKGRPSIESQTTISSEEDSDEEIDIFNAQLEQFVENTESGAMDADNVEEASMRSGTNSFTENSYKRSNLRVSTGSTTSYDAARRIATTNCQQAYQEQILSPVDIKMNMLKSRIKKKVEWRRRNSPKSFIDTNSAKDKLGQRIAQDFPKVWEKHERLAAIKARIKARKRDNVNGNKSGVSNIPPSYQAPANRMSDANKDREEVISVSYSLGSKSSNGSSLNSRYMQQDDLSRSSRSTHKSRNSQYSFGGSQDHTESLSGTYSEESKSSNSTALNSHNWREDQFSRSSNNFNKANKNRYSFGSAETELRNNSSRKSFPVKTGEKVSKNYRQSFPHQTMLSNNAHNAEVRKVVVPKWKRYSVPSSLPSQNSSLPSTTGSKNQDGTTGTCYLRYLSSAGGKLIVEYSKSGNVPSDALAKWTPQEPNTIPAFKFSGHATSELIGNCAAGMQGRKNFYSGWCQFVRLAKLSNGIVTMLNGAETDSGIGVDLFAYVTGNTTLKLGNSFSTEDVMAIACLPRHADFYDGMKIDMTKWVNEGSQIGSATFLKQGGKAAAAPPRYSESSSSHRIEPRFSESSHHIVEPEADVFSEDDDEYGFEANIVEEDEIPVHNRLKELERQNREERLRSDPTRHHKVSWSNVDENGQYWKTIKDVRGVAPRKSLEDLP